MKEELIMENKSSLSWVEFYTEFSTALGLCPFVVSLD